MIAFENIAPILLCAGLSRRFGEGDKLLHPVGGHPLVLHAARTIASLPFRHKIAVAPPGAALEALLVRQGFTMVVNPRPEDGQPTSLRLGVRRALDFDPDAVLVCLGDMPYVTAAHLHALADAADDTIPAASTGEGIRCPPILFPRAFLSRLADEDVPMTARRVLEEAAEVALVPAPAGMLADLDTREDFEAAELRAAASDCSS